MSRAEFEKKKGDVVFKAYVPGWPAAYPGEVDERKRNGVDGRKKAQKAQG